MRPDAEGRAARLNERYRHHAAMAVLSHALTDPEVGPLALVSSFGTESVVLLHMVAVLDRRLPVLFLDTGMLFADTLAYQLEVTERLRLEDVRVIRPDRAALLERDADGLLHQAQPDACCALRKVEPLARALKGFDGWITGRKRFQGGARAALEFFEADGEGRIKVNPLAHWRPEDVAEYMAENRLPRHPLAARGYRSVGCVPCTTRTAPGEGVRAGRWRGLDKTECGIHLVDGRVVRGVPV